MRRIQSIHLPVAHELIIFFSGIIIFTYFAQQRGFLFLFSFIGLLLSVLVVVRHVSKWKELKEAFGLNSIKKENVYFIPLSILAAVFFSLLYRYYLHLDLFPTRFITFSFLAAMIGATEEFVFRGYIQSRSREFGIVLSILIAAMTHTIYKVVLFFSLEAVEMVNIGFLAFWTMVIGLVLGVMREFSGSCFIPVIFHVIFDILVYGDGSIETWWVFG